MSIRIRTPRNRGSHTTAAATRFGPGLYRGRSDQYQTNFRELKWADAFVALVWFLVGYGIEVVRGAVLLLRYPLATVLAVWLLGALLNRSATAVGKAFSPLCGLPVVGAACTLFPMISESSSSTSPVPPTERQPRWADYPALVEAQVNSLEKLLVESSAGLVLGAGIRQAQIATADLITLVKISNIDGRDDIADALQRFTVDAKLAAKELNRLDSRVNRAYDK